MAETNTPNPQLPGVKTRIPWQNAADVDWAEDLPDIADAPWYFFHLPKVQDQLRQLPWSYQECAARITPKGKGVGIHDYGLMPIPHLFSSHGVLQLALWTTPVFHEAPEGYIYAPATSASRHPKPYACPKRPELFDALADALLWYEYRCRYLYDELGYDMLRAKMENAFRILEIVPDIFERLHKKGYSPEHPSLKSQYKQIRKAFEYLKTKASLMTENDFSRAGGAVQGKGYGPSTDIKKRLLRDMRNAFQYHGPVTFHAMETYRSIVEILKAFGVEHQQAGYYKIDGVERALRRAIDPVKEFAMERHDWTIKEMLRNNGQNRER